MPDITSGGERSPPARPSSGGARISRREVLTALSTTVGAGALVGSAAGAPIDWRSAPRQETPAEDPIREAVWVETAVDTDDDGVDDRIYLEVARPQSTADGETVPVIAIASPYNGEQTHSDATEAMFYDRERRTVADSEASDTASVGAGIGDRTGVVDGGVDGTGHANAGGHHPAHHAHSLHIESRYVPRGYAVAHVSSLGTHRSTGCYTAAAPVTFRALASVVDWFNGRATAYDAQEGGATVAADWTNGRTGMMGGSAHGELANGVATTGVDGLEAIVPQVADASHYMMFRSNGTPISVIHDPSEGMRDLGTWVQAGTAAREDCGHWVDRVEDGQDGATGDYNDFWHEREMLTEADAVEAAVLITHTVDDPTVKPNQFADWYETLAAEDVPLRLWLHEGGHSSPGGEAWFELLDRWWAHWLKGEDTGVMDEPPVDVVHGGRSPEEGTLESYDDWPVPGSEHVDLYVAGGGPQRGRATLEAPDAAEEQFTDNSSALARDLARAAESTHRLRYETPPLTERVHVSGRVVPRLAVSFDDPTVVSAALLEYGPGGPEIVTRGWADPRNRPRYSEYDAPLSYRESLRESSPIGTDEQVVVEFPLQATDHVFQPDSRIGVVVYATDRAFTLHPPGEATITPSLAESAVAVPVVGGRSALEGAFGERETLTEGSQRRGDGSPGSGGEGGTDGGTATSESGDGFGALAVGGALAGLGAGGFLRGRRRDGDDGE